MAKKLQVFLGQYLSADAPLEQHETAESEISWPLNYTCGGRYAGFDTVNAAGSNRQNGTVTNVAAYTSWKWKVPAGVTRATFKVWGGGGTGAASHCCMQGMHAGSGAHAVKEVAVTAGNVYCSCYQDLDKVCCSQYNNIAGQTLDQAAGSWPNMPLHRGERGPKAFVTGPGLTNFCAEGGNPGITRCNWWVCYFGTITGAKACCKTVCMKDVVQRTMEDSVGDVYRRANYYGADIGSKGMWSCMQIGCCGADNVDASRCGDKHFIPYPGGLNHWNSGFQEKVSINGGMTMYKQCNIHPDMFGMMVSNLSQSMGRQCQSWGAQTVPGMPGLITWTCGGTCCCGSTGGPPLVKISYS